MAERRAQAKVQPNNPVQRTRPARRVVACFGLVLRRVPLTGTIDATAAVEEASQPDFAPHTKENRALPLLRVRLQPAQRAAHKARPLLCLYTCVSDLKRRTNCPVKRLNADALHFTVLTLIERAARHRTIIGWSVASQEQKDLRGALARQRAGVQTSIANIVSAIADGRGRDALMTRLGKLEHQDWELAAALATVAKQIAEATMERPTAAQVKAA